MTIKSCPVASGRTWNPHTPGDSRSPCPALNTLANYGYLPRSGRDISLIQLIKAIREAYHLTWPLAIFLVVGGYYLINKWWKIDLEDLAIHDGIEHDASLAHGDASIAVYPSYAPTTVNPGMLDQLLDESADGQHMTAADIAQARVRRESIYSPGAIDRVHQEIARGEMALVVGIFGGGVAIPNEYLRTWIHDERFPDGWVHNEKRLGLIETILYSSDIRHAMERIRGQRK